MSCNVRTYQIGSWPTDAQMMQCKNTWLVQRGFDWTPAFRDTRHWRDFIFSVEENAVRDICRNAFDSKHDYIRIYAIDNGPERQYRAFGFDAKSGEIVRRHPLIGLDHLNAAATEALMGLPRPMVLNDVANRAVLSLQRIEAANLEFLIHDREGLPVAKSEYKRRLGGVLASFRDEQYAHRPFFLKIDTAWRGLPGEEYETYLYEYVRQYFDADMKAIVAAEKVAAKAARKAARAEAKLNT